MSSPVLSAIIALVTLPLAVSTSITQTPLPVIWARFAWYGYSGRGALTAIAFAADIDISSGTGNLGSVGFGPEVACLFPPVFFSASAVGVATSSGAGVCSATGAGF